MCFGLALWFCRRFPNTQRAGRLCGSRGRSQRWIPESLFLNYGLWRRLASGGINQVLTTCQPYYLQQGAISHNTAEYRGTKESIACGPEAAAPVAYLPPSCRRACAPASARAPSFPSSCCRWCCPSLVHLGNCGHTLAVRSGRPRRRECIFTRTKEMSEKILAILTMKRQNQKIKVCQKIYIHKKEYPS